MANMSLDWWCNEADVRDDDAAASPPMPGLGSAGEVEVAGDGAETPTTESVEAWDSVSWLGFLPEDAFSEADGGAADDEAASSPAAVSPPRKRARRADPGESLSRAVVSSCLKL